MTRVFECPETSPQKSGEAHGEAFREDIAGFCDIRIKLCLEQYGFESQTDLFDYARAHAEATRDNTPSEYDELEGIARGANQPVEAITVLNHYTDLRDRFYRKDGDEGCSMFWLKQPAVLAQTWDMHLSAMPYVLMLGTQVDDVKVWSFTLTGCLGMAGINEFGIAVGINNLRSTDAGIGTVWPAVIRRLLTTKTLNEADGVMAGLTIASGHHYLMADEHGKAISIETSGTRRVRTDLAGAHFVHTNHALDKSIAERSFVSPSSTTFKRLASVSKILQASPPASLEACWQVLGSREGYPGSVCTNTATYDNPHGSATCGGIAMDMASRNVMACGGFVSHARPVALSARRG